jgi:hypothetical protein
MTDRQLKALLNRGDWTAEEDAAIEEWVQEKGTKHWVELAANLPNRTPRECRERWEFHFHRDRPSVKWSEFEDAMLIEYQQTLGNRWKLIASELPGRSECAIKSRWNSLMKKRRKQWRDSCEVRNPRRATRPN